MKKNLLRLAFAGALFALAVITEHFIMPSSKWIEIGIFLVAYFIAGYDVLWRAVRNITQGKVFDENFLMCIATIGALAILQFAEAVAVMLFYQLGELFQSYAVQKSRKSIASLMDIRPDYANLLRDGEIVKVSPEEVKVGDTIIVCAGEKIPLDGRVIDGFSTIDTSALTGESVPREAVIGNEVISGCININGLLTVQVEKEFGESAVSKILDLVENAASKKAKVENFISRFAKVYTPIVVVLAVLLAALPPLLISNAEFSVWFYRALTFLVVSCPCALVLSIPLSFFGGIGGASRIGVLLKGGNCLEALASAETIVFDKTGTLTKGVFKVQEIFSQGITKEELLKFTAYAENFSNHPISASLKAAYGKEINAKEISNVEEIAGHGVVANVSGKQVACGNVRLMEKLGISYLQDDYVGTAVHTAIDGMYAGYITIADEIKEDSFAAIKNLKAAGIKHIVMLTGDNKKVGQKIASLLAIDNVYAELLPQDKVERLEELIAATSTKGRLAFVGDGINDAPVLARADIGIAMGGLGSDAAIEAADIVIMTDEPSKIISAMKVSKKTMRIVRQNIVFALGIKFLVLVLSAIGITSMWAAIFADVGVSVIAVLNAFRALKTPK